VWGKNIADERYVTQGINQLALGTTGPLGRRVPAQFQRRIWPERDCVRPFGMGRLLCLCRSRAWLGCRLHHEPDGGRSHRRPAQPCACGRPLQGPRRHDVARFRAIRALLSARIGALKWQLSPTSDDYSCNSERSPLVGCRRVPLMPHRGTFRSFPSGKPCGRSRQELTSKACSTGAQNDKTPQGAEVGPTPVDLYTMRWLSLLA